MVNLENYEEYMMLYADGELTQEQEQALLAFVAGHPGLEKELDAYMSTVLQPDTAMIFEGKEALLKQPGGSKTVWFSGWKNYTAAACILLAVALLYFNREASLNEEDTTIAETITDTHEHTNEATIQKPVNEEAVKLQPKTPVNAIAMETNKEPEPAKNKVEITEPRSSARERELSTTLLATASAPMQVSMKKAEAAYMTVAESVPPIRVQLPEEKHTVAIETPFSSSKQGIALIENAVEEKLAMAKNIKENIKDRDITFQIGKKELFTLKL